MFLQTMENILDEYREELKEQSQQSSSPLWINFQLKLHAIIHNCKHWNGKRALIVQAECPKRDDVGITAFDVVLDKVAFWGILYLFNSHAILFNMKKICILHEKSAVFVKNCTK